MEYTLLVISGHAFGPSSSEERWAAAVQRRNISQASVLMWSPVERCCCVMIFITRWYFTRNFLKTDYMSFDFKLNTNNAAVPQIITRRWYSASQATSRYFLNAALFNWKVFWFLRPSGGFLPKSEDSKTIRYLGWKLWNDYSYKPSANLATKILSVHLTLSLGHNLDKSVLADWTAAAFSADYCVSFTTTICSVSAFNLKRTLH